MGIDVALPGPDEMDEPLGGDRPYTILGELGRGKFRQKTMCNEALIASGLTIGNTTFLTNYSWFMLFFYIVSKHRCVWHNNPCDGRAEQRIVCTKAHCMRKC